MHAPTTPSPNRQAVAARYGQMKRWHGADDPRTIHAAQDVAEQRIQRAIEQAVAAAPPLRAEQADRLADLIRGGVR